MKLAHRHLVSFLVLIVAVTVFHACSDDKDDNPNRDRFNRVSGTVHGGAVHVAGLSRQGGMSVQNRPDVRVEVVTGANYSSTGVCEDRFSFDVAADEVELTAENGGVEGYFAGKRLRLVQAEYLSRSLEEDGDVEYLQGMYDGRQAHILCHTAELRICRVHNYDVVGRGYKDKSIIDEMPETLSGSMSFPEVMDIEKGVNINKVRISLKVDGDLELPVSSVIDEIKKRGGTNTLSTSSADQSIDMKLVAIGKDELEIRVNLKGSSGGADLDVLMKALYRVEN